MTVPTDSVYSWQRFWCLREGTYQLDVRGYVANPTGAWGELSQDLRTYQDLAEVPVLVLLGEPGVGKSHEMVATAQHEEHRVRGTRDRVLTLDLRDIQTDLGLR